MKIQVDKDIHIELLVPVFAECLYNLTSQNRAHLKKWLGWLDLVKTFEDTQLIVYRHRCTPTQ
jgi:ribosomal-protein-serine acetyltransferase